MKKIKRVKLTERETENTEQRDILGRKIYPITDQTEVGNASFNPILPPKRTTQQTKSEEKSKKNK